MAEFLTDIPADIVGDADFTEVQRPEPVPPDLRDWAEKRSVELWDTFKYVRDSNLSDHYRLLKAYKDFITYTDPNMIDYDTKFKVPMIYNHVRITFARWLDAARSVSKLCKVRPAAGIFLPQYGMNFADAEFRSKLGEAATNASLEMGQAMLRMLGPAMDCLIMGRVITKTGWAVKYRRDPMTNRTIDSEFAAIIRVTPFNYYQDPYALDEQSARWTYELLEQTEEDIRECMAARIYLDDCLDEQNPRIRPQVGGSGTYNALRQQTRQFRNMYEMGGPTGYYHNVESWTYEDPRQTGLPSLWCFFFDADTGKLLGCHENPFPHGERPYEVGWMLPVPDQPFGIGLAEALHPLNEMQNSTLQHVHDNFAGQNVRHLIMDGSILDEVALKRSVPNGIVRTTNMEAWKIIQGQAMHPESWQFLSFFDGKAQETSGVTDVVSAVRAAATAYASDLLRSQSQINFNVFLDCMKLSWMDKVMRHTFANAQAFMDMDVLGSVDIGSGQTMRLPIRRHDFQGRYIVEAEDLRSMAKRQQMAQQIGTITAQAMQAQIPLNYYYLLKQNYQLLDLPEPEQAFNTGQPMQQPGMPMPPQGVAGQSDPNSMVAANQAPSSSTSDSDAVRLAMRTGIMGEAPADLSGLLGGSPAGGGGS